MFLLLVECFHFHVSVFSSLFDWVLCCVLCLCFSCFVFPAPEAAQELFSDRLIVFQYSV